MSNPAASVSDAERRAWSYWFVDGLPHMVSGVGCLVVAATILMSNVLPNRKLVVVFTVITYGLAALILFCMRRILEWLKARITYPRTGYATPPYFAEQAPPVAVLTMLAIQGADAQRAIEAERLRQDQWRRGVLLVAIYTVAAMLTAVVVADRWICLVAGLACGAILWLVAGRDDRLSGVVLLSLPFSAIYVSLFAVLRSERLAFFLAGVGILLLLKGTVKLVEYLRQHPFPPAS